MWTHKNSDTIIYIDVEKRLEVKPTIFCSNEQTPFKDDTFDTIFYDPPHTWGVYHRSFSQPNLELQRKVFPKGTKLDPYYGWDKFSSRQKLIRHIYNAQEEFKRILKPDGLLLLKWNEMSISKPRVLSIFNNWMELIDMILSSVVHPMGGHRTYWIILQQKQEKVSQQPLLDFL